MLPREKYQYSKYRNTNADLKGRARVFVAPKEKFEYNPVINWPQKPWGNILIVLLIGILFYFFSYSHYFGISEIINEGNKLVLSEEIAKKVSRGENIFRFNITKAKTEIIQTSPIIEDIAIYRGIPNTIKIMILERDPVLVWQSGGKFYLIDGAGVIDKEVNQNEFSELIHLSDQKNIPVKIGDQVISSEFIKFITDINNNFFQYCNIKVSGFQLQETTFDLYVFTEAGFYVKFDTTRPYDKQLTDLKNTIINYRENIREYVDVRINGWVYYK